MLYNKKYFLINKKKIDLLVRVYNKKNCFNIVGIYKNVLFNKSVNKNIKLVEIDKLLNNIIKKIDRL